jgi:hypothetical protein
LIIIQCSQVLARALGFDRENTVWTNDYMIYVPPSSGQENVMNNDKDRQRSQRIFHSLLALSTNTPSSATCEKKTSAR